MELSLFDAFLSIGRTNGAIPQAPCSEREVLALMDRHRVADAMVFHTTGRDSDPELGNAALADLTSSRLHKVWAFDPACAIAETPDEFLERALADGAKAILVNPLMRDVRIDRSLRLRDLAAILERRHIPLLAVYRQFDAGQDVIDWYQLADFCTRFPDLPVLAWQWRSRSNRPMFDALAETANLRVSLSSIWQAQMVETICERFGPQRLVFSLGLPALDGASFGPVLAYADVDDRSKALIAGGTMRKLLQEASYD